MAESLEEIVAERRLGEASSAYSFYEQMLHDDRTRQQSFAKITNQLNGGRPFDQNKLVESGQGWRCNINFRDAASTLEQVLISYWRLLHDSTSLAALEMHYDHPKADSWAQTFQLNFNRFIEDWGDQYVRNYLLFSYNHLAYGVGAVIYPDRDSPRWEVVRTGDILVPERTKASTNDMETAMVRQEVTISELWERIRTDGAKKASAAMGWDVDTVKKVLYRAIHGNYRTETDDWMRIEDEVRNNSLRLSSKTGPISVVHMFVKEFDGKIAHLMMAPDVVDDAFLFDDYASPRRYDRMGEVLSCVFFEAGNGLFHGIKGFGQKNYQLSLAMNRLKSRAMDRTLIDGLNFKDMGEGARTTVPVTNIGPINILPKDLEQITSYPGGNAVFEALGMIEQTQNYNNARYRDQSQQIERSQTATQARILSNLQSQVDVANSTLYLTQIARNLFTEQFNRLRRKGNKDSDAKKFRERCLEGGVPEEIFYEAEMTVRTGADPGAASAALRAEISMQLMGMVGNRHVNDRATIETYVGNTLGASAVKKLLRPEDQLEDRNSVRLALIENTSLGDGIPIPADEGDNHPVHIEAHLQPLKAIVDNFNANGQINPDQMIALETAIPHVAEHFEYLQADELQKETYQQLWPIFSEIVSIAGGIMRRLEQQANNPQAQEGGLPTEAPESVAAQMGGPAQQPQPPPDAQVPQQPIPQAPAAQAAPGNIPV